MSAPPKPMPGTATTRIALVGNPNTGKSTLFNALTGVLQRVGNYPGVTVEQRAGTIPSTGGPTLELIDLPGAYSLAATGPDEAVLLDVLLGRQRGQARPDGIVCVVDASNLTRNLFLASQVLELGLPVVIALNMTDLAERSGVRIDAERLTARLGVPVIPVVATRSGSLAALRTALTALATRPAPHHVPAFPDRIRDELDGLCARPPFADHAAGPTAQRVFAMQVLLGPGGHHEARALTAGGPQLAEDLAERRRRIVGDGEALEDLEARIRYRWIEQRLAGAVTRPTAHVSASQRADRILTHRVWGTGIMVIIMGLCFQTLYTWAGPFMDGIDGLFGMLGAVVGQWIPEGALHSLVVDGVIAGVGGVLVFLPQILMLFGLLAILEDCGYMARAALLLDRWMGLVGLSGKSFFPLMSSFACAIPGIMATRTIEQRRDRFLTILIAPLMSCSARLPLYVLLIGAFIPARSVLGGTLNLQAATLLAMYASGVVVAIPISLVLKWTAFRGPAQSFLLELPSYKWPAPRTVLTRVLIQGRAFVVTAGTLIFCAALIVWALGYYPRSAAIGEAHEAERIAARGALSGDALDAALTEIGQREAGAALRNSFLGRMGQWIEPAVRPLGWDWRIGTAAIAAFPARELVVSTMGTIYNLGHDETETSSGLRERLAAATWPDGRPVFNVPVALSMMVFFALCCQCSSTLAVIRRETDSWRWPIFTFVYMTALAYVAALLTYQIGMQVSA